MQQLPTLSKHDLLAALQAGMVYLIMRVIDGATEPVEWNRDLAMAQSVCAAFPTTNYHSS